MAPTRKKKKRTQSDAYVGMLFVSLLAMITGSVLLYLDYSQYDSDVPKVQEAKFPQSGGGAAPRPAGGSGSAGSGGQ